MQPFASGESPVAARRGSEVMVSMFDEHLVISPPDRIDLDSTGVLVMAAASAVASGSTVMIDLDPQTHSDELVARRPTGDQAASCAIAEGGPVSVLGPGYIRLAVLHGYWTIDLTRGRLFRSQDEIQPHFIGAGDWSDIQALWVSPHSLTALAGDGTYLSTHAAWTVERRRQHRLTA